MEKKEAKSDPKASVAEEGGLLYTKLRKLITVVVSKLLIFLFKLACKFKLSYFVTLIGRLSNALTLNRMNLEMLGYNSTSTCQGLQYSVHRVQENHLCLNPSSELTSCQEDL